MSLRGEDIFGLERKDVNTSDGLRRKYMSPGIKKNSDMLYGGTYYYHGSPHKIEGHLEPRALKTEVIGGEKAVFATSKYWFSLCFIANWSDDDIDQGYYGDMPYISERTPNAFDVFKGASGYIYYVDPKQFKSDKRIIPGVEYISDKKVKILKTEYIEDVYKALQKTEVNMITYDMKNDAYEKYIPIEARAEAIAKYIEDKN